MRTVGGIGELAGDQQVSRPPVRLDVPHLGPRAPEVRRDGLVRVFLRVEDRKVAHLAPDLAVVSFDLGEAAAQPDVGADLLDGPDALVDHGGFVGGLGRHRQGGRR